MPNRPTRRATDRPTKHRICSSITISIAAASAHARASPPTTRRRICFLLSLRRHYIGSRRVWCERAVVRNGRRKKERRAAIQQPAKMMTNFLRKVTQNQIIQLMVAPVYIATARLPRDLMTGVIPTGPGPCMCGEIPKIG